ALRRRQPLRRRRHGHFAMDGHRHHQNRRAHRSAWLRLLHLPQRQGDQEGFVLEDRREDLSGQPHGPRRGACWALAHGPRDGAALGGALVWPAIASRRAMRSSIGGWVENRLAMPPADKGLAM